MSMKRLYSLLCGLLLAGMLCVGLISLFDRDAEYSESEKRKLKTFPQITFSALLDGSLLEDIREYYADTFPGRETLLDSNRTLNGFYYFSGLAGEDDVQLVIDFNTGAAEGGEALQVEDPSGTGDPEEEETTEETQKPLDSGQQTEPAAQTEMLGNILFIGDRALDAPYMKPASIRAYAAAVTAIADTLGPEVQTYSMPVPNSAEFYTKAEYHTGNYSQKAMFELCREELGDNVTFIDAYSVLAQHTDEYIYFRTDHHWTHLGAYYAYTALCDAVGFTAESRDRFETGQWNNFVGSMYTYISNYPQSAVLKNNPDTVYYWKPYVDCTTYYYSNTDLDDGVLMGTICRVREEVSNKYLTFMGGDHPVTIVETDVDGPCILVIKESYGNALISWLTSHYSKIILIDPREYFDGNSDIDLKAFAQEQGVDQCLVINYPMMLNSDGYIAKLEKLTQ